MKLDVFDQRILAALQRDGALTNGALAEIVRLSASQCSRRRAALEGAGVIEGYHARLNAAKLGFAMRVIVRVTLRAHTKEDHLRFSKWLDLQAEVKAAFSDSSVSRIWPCTAPLGCARMACKVGPPPRPMDPPRP